MTIETGLRSRAGRTAFFVSLCLNLVLGGYLASQWLWPSPSAGQPVRLLMQITQSLPSADAAVIEQSFRSRLPQIVENRAEFNRSVSRLLDLLATPVVDEKSVREAIEQARARRLQQQDPLVEAFVAAIVKISPTGRERLVAELRAAQGRLRGVPVLQR